MDKELLERLDFIEFRQELLFENTDWSRLLFESKVTKEQQDNIFDLFDALRKKISSGEAVSSTSYESEIYRIIPQCENSYHFAESIAQTLHESGRWDEVFVALYGHAPKFQTYLGQN